MTDHPRAGQNPQADAVLDPYGIRLDVFEGPLDLLLYLIRKSEVDIYDIPIATITNQYLAFLSTGVRFLDLEQAADFILMAATLMKIKSQMLLPREIQDEDLDEGLGDPREELVRRLLEYQQFKEIADWLGDKVAEQRDVYQRSGHLDEADAEAGLHPVSLFDLLKVYKHVLEHVPARVVHRVLEEQVSIDECIQLILEELEARSRLRFHDLVQGRSTEGLVATFIGVLELLKGQRIRVQQARPFDDIWIESRAEDAATPTEATESTGPAEVTESGEAEPAATEADIDTDVVSLPAGATWGPGPAADTDTAADDRTETSAADNAGAADAPGAPEASAAATPPVPPPAAQPDGWSIDAEPASAWDDDPAGDAVHAGLGGGEDPAAQLLADDEPDDADRPGADDELSDTDRPGADEAPNEPDRTTEPEEEDRS